MEVAKLLNSEDESSHYTSSTRQERPGAEYFRRLPSISSTSSSSSYFSGRGSYYSLGSYDNALPPLYRSNSSDSRSTRSPLTPTYTPERTPNVSFERDHKRHYSGTQRVPSSYQYAQDPSRSSSNSPKAPRHPMDNFEMPMQGGFDATIAFPTYTQPPMSHIPTAVVSQKQQSLPELTQPLAISPLVPSDAETPSQSSQPKPPKKNAYPCPVSRQYGCPEFFTTSGHAARHAKKHTGKKDAICPECQKAFTRKDNMEQHRRTHAGGRNGSKSANSDDSRQRKVMKLQQQQKKANKQARAISEVPQQSFDSQRQGMPATITDAHTVSPFDATHSVLLDPQLRSPMSGTSFPDEMDSMRMSLGQPMDQMPSLEIASAAPIPNMYRHSPQVRQHPPASMQSIYLQPPLSMPSPSAVSCSSNPEDPGTPRSPLDTLALAASLEQ